MATESNNKNLNVPNLRFPEFSKSYSQTTISKLATIVGGGTPDTTFQEYWNGGIQWFTPSEIGKNKYADKSERTISQEGLNNSSAKLLPINTILLSTRATIGESSIAKVECCTNQGFQSLIANEEIVCYEYLYYLVATLKKELIRKSCGSTFLEISANEVRKIKTFIPSIGEQSKVSSLLSLIDDRISTQIKIIEKLESLIKGIYEKLFNISDADYVSLGSIALIQKGQQINGEELSKQGTYYVMNGGIVPSGFLESYNTSANTISISEGGNSCGYVQYNSVPFWSGGHCYTLIESEVSFNYKYLYHYLKYMEPSIMALRIGSGLPNIQKKDLERFPIMNICIDEQNKMVCMLDDLSAKISIERKIAIYYEEQKKYLLSNLFI